MRNGLSQSTYDQIITYFLGQSSVYTDSMNLSEWHIYGSSRIGIYQTSINMAYRNVRIVNGVTTQETNTTVAWPSYTLFDIQRGAKRYELTNHLGNVLVVVSDKKIQVCTSTAISYYTADLVSATDYSPFGAPLAERTYTAPNISYRFAFNGQEKDDEVSGAGNTMGAEYWEYDSRLGRRWNIDPISYPWQSTYCVFNNCPISFADPNGLVGVNPPGAPENPCPGDKYKHKNEQGTEWEYEYNEKEGWQSNGGTQTKPLKDVIVKPPLTNKGDVVTASNLPPSPSSSNTPSSADIVSTVAIGVSPAGIGLDLYTLSTGRDYGTQEKVSMGWRIAGVVPFVSEIKGIKKLINLSKLSRLALTFGKLHKHHVLPKAFKP